MDRDSLVQQLAQARQHAREGAEQIARQQRIIAALKLRGEDVRLPTAVLQTTIALQVTVLKRCLRLQRQLAAIDRDDAEKRPAERVRS